jgi:hypothetical protein
VEGQFALATSERIVPVAVWETLSAERQQQLVVALARLLARLVEAERDD